MAAGRSCSGVLPGAELSLAPLLCDQWAGADALGAAPSILPRLRVPGLAAAFGCGTSTSPGVEGRAGRARWGLEPVTLPSWLNMALE